MMKMLYISFFLFLGSYLNAEAQVQNRVLASVDSFRNLADFIFGKLGSINPDKIFEGATIYVQRDRLGIFFIHFHPKIPNRYILITHQNDKSSPKEYARYLEDDKIIAWLGENPSIRDHKKFYPIPIGFVGKNWPHGDRAIIKKVQKLELEKEYLAYLNIRVKTAPYERKKVVNLFRNKDFCYYVHRCNFEEYLMDLKQSKFTFSPRGNGLDCHRTWEAILMGSIPIVTTSYLDPLFEDLPVLIIKNWEHITEDLLEEKFLEFQNKTFCLDKLYIDYWRKLIQQIREKENIL